MRTKDKLLLLLEENKDNYISGEEIATTLGVSRNAIWKAVNDLRSMGYEIDAIKNRGYMLSSSNDILSAQGIITYLDESISPEIFVYKTIESTNRTAKEMAINHAVHGTVVISDNQTGGIGHNGEGFTSPAGGLYMSIILDPNKLSFSDNALISPFSAIAVCKAIESLTDINPSIRLITDIFSGEEKIAGILNESAFDFETGKLQWIVVGIGIPKKIATTRNQLVAAIMNNILNEKYSREEILDYYKGHHK